MARVYYGEFTSIAGVVHRVEIWDGASGSATSGSELRLTGDGYRLERQGEGETIFDNVVRKSKVTAYFAIDNDTDAAYFENMSYSNEASHAMIIYKNNNPVWVGRVLSDLFQWSRSAVSSNRIYEIVSVDTLSLLDNYHISTNWLTSGKITLLHLFTEILKSTGLHAYWTSIGKSGYFIADALNTYETTSGSNYRLPRFRINAQSLIEKYDPTDLQIKSSDEVNLDNITCLEALKIVLADFLAYIVLENGMYFIHQSQSFSTTVIYDVYSVSEVLTATNNTINPTHTINNVNRPSFDAYPTLSYQPAVKSIEMTIDKAVSLKVAKPWRTPYNNSVLSIGAVSVYEAGDVKFDFYINFIPNYKNKYTLFYRGWAIDRTTGNRYNWNGSTWVLGTSTTYSKASIDLPFKKNYNTNPYSHTFRSSFTYPSNALMVDFDFYFDMYLQETSFTIGSLFVKTAYPFTGAISCTQELSDNFNIYTNTTNAGATKVIQRNPTFYDGLGSSGVGTIQVYNGTTWSDASSWVAIGGVSGSFQQILAKQIIALYSKALKSVNCSFNDNGNYHALKTINFDSATWIMNGYTYSAQMEKYDGEWLRLAMDYTGIDVGSDQYFGNPKKQSEFRIQATEVETKNIMAVGSSIADNLPVNLFVNQFENVPSIDTLFQTDIKFNSTDVAFEMNLVERGSKSELTAGTHSLDTLNEMFICDTSSGAVTINLPDADTVKGRKFTLIKSTTANSVTISGTINGLTSYVLNSLNESVVIESDGVQFWAISDNKQKPSSNSNVLIDGGTFETKNSFIDAGGFVTE